MVTAYHCHYFWAVYSVLLNSHVCFHASTFYFFLLYLYNIVWNQGAWYLQLCPSFSTLFCLFRVSLRFHRSFKIILSLKNGIGILIGIALNLRFWYSTSSPTLDIVCVLNFSHSNRCAVRSHSCFNSHFHSIHCWW